VYDCIVVGSGIAGLYVASLLRDARVLVLTKAGLADGNTNQAQGGIAAAVGPSDSPELHWRDTVAAGAGLTDPMAAWVIAQEAPAAIADLVRYGVAFDRDGDKIALAQEGAHSRPRVLHAGGDATGAHIQAALGAAVAKAKHITVSEHRLATELITSGGRARGVVAVDSRSGESVRYLARSVVLATGGAGQLYQHTTNPPVATGTGIALAYLGGASVSDLEFCQFHPTALVWPGAPSFLITEAARGEGGRLLNVEGHRFMPDYDPLGELAPRHIVASAILAEMARFHSPFVHLDLTHLPPELVLRRFPTVASFCKALGLDITRSPIPVAPAAHYMMGGVRTNLWGETDVRALYACGEVACTGVHGANRLASNSLLEALVFGSRIARSINSVLGRVEDTRYSATTIQPILGSPTLAYAPVPEETRLGPPVLCAPSAQHSSSSAIQAMDGSMEDLQALMWTCAGPVRCKDQLASAARQLARWAAAAPASIDSRQERRNMLLTAQLVVAAALAREETRGAHRRSDFPAEDPAWRRRVSFRRDAQSSQ
jgi:L-aspartate oxidase